MSYSIKERVGFSLNKLNINTNNTATGNYRVAEAIAAENINNKYTAKSNNVGKYGAAETLNVTETLDVNQGTVVKNSGSPAGIDYSQLKKDGFTAQGYTTYDGKVLVTGYSKNGEKSRIYVYDEKTGELSNIIVLDNKSHVGGMSVDENGVLFVTKSGGKIETYNLKELQKQFGDNQVIDFSNNKYDKYKIENDINTGESEATIYCYDGKVYTATYGFKGTIKEITYTYENGKIKANTRVLSNNIASTIQGLSIYKDKNGKEYLVTASSSEKIGSRIRIYEKNGDELKRVSSHNTKLEGLEGIKIDENGNITGICEYGKQKVSDLGSVEDYINMIKKSHIGFLNNDFLFSMSGLVWDLQNNKMT